MTSTPEMAKRREQLRIRAEKREQLQRRRQNVMQKRADAASKPKVVHKHQRKKHALQPAKRKLSSTDSETSHCTSHDSESSLDVPAMPLSQTDPPCTMNKLTDAMPEKGDYVLVTFQCDSRPHCLKETPLVHDAGPIQSVHRRQYEVKFRRRKRGDPFYYPTVDDIADVPEVRIIAILHFTSKRRIN